MNNILKVREIPQRTREWYNIRNGIITATNVSSIINANPYKNRKNLLIEKLENMNIDSHMKNKNMNKAMEWGVKFEPIAKEIYEEKCKDKVYDCGLIMHKEYTWLGASPDGILSNKKLIEIKCPYSRDVHEKIPYYYWIQVQIQLEVCNCDECDFIQAKFVEYNNIEEYQKDKSPFQKGVYIDNVDSIEEDEIYWKLEDYKISTIKRNRNWFQTNLKRIHKFYTDMNYYKENGISNLTTKRKRSNSESSINVQSSTQNKRHDKIQLIDDSNMSGHEDYFNNYNNWNNSYQIMGFVYDDPIICWLELFGKKNLFNRDISKFAIMRRNQKSDFYNNITKVFIQKENNYKLITCSDELISYDKYKETLSNIENKTPIIIGGILMDKDSHEYEHYDYLILGKTIKKLSLLNNDELKIVDDIYYPIQVVHHNVFMLKKNYILVILNLI